MNHHFMEMGRKGMHVVFQQGRKQGENMGVAFVEPLRKNNQRTCQGIGTFYSDTNRGTAIKTFQEIVGAETNRAPSLNVHGVIEESRLLPKLLVALVVEIVLKDNNL